MVFGKDDREVPDGQRAGKRRRKLYFRIYLDADGDEVRIGEEIKQDEVTKGVHTITGPRWLISSIRFASMSSSNGSDQSRARSKVAPELQESFVMKNASRLAFMSALIATASCVLATMVAAQPAKEQPAAEKWEGGGVQP